MPRPNRSGGRAEHLLRVYQAEAANAENLKSPKFRALRKSSADLQSGCGDFC